MIKTKQKRTKINIDKPINSEQDDLLGVGQFCKYIIDVILKSNKNNEFVIGLYGPWGTGKTSIINIIKEKLNSIEANRKPIIVNYEPWQFTNNEDLVREFLKTIRIGFENPEVKSEEIVKAINNYSEYFDFLNNIPTVGTIYKFGKMFISFANKEIKDKTSLDIKDSVANELKKLDRKVVVIIDDIDRLNDEQIRMIFQLVKQIGNLPNLYYILSMDKEIVVNALNKTQDNHGDDYLEKIVQLPLNVPKMNFDKVYDIFKEKLYGIIDINDSHFNNVSNYCIKPYIKNLRDVNRILNKFEADYYFLGEEVNAIDLLGLSTLSCLKDNIYNCIYENKDMLCEIENYEYLLNDKLREENNKEIIKEMKDIYKCNDIDIKAISSLFPVLHGSDIYLEKETEEEKIDNKRISSKFYFDEYFSLKISENMISTYLIEKMIRSLNEEKLKNEIIKIVEKQQTETFSNILNAKTSEIPNNRIETILSSLYSTKYLFDYSIGNDDVRIDYLTWKLLKLIRSKEEREQILISIIKRSNANSLEAIGINLNDALVEIKKGKTEVLDEIQINIIIDKYLVRIKQLIKNNEILEAKSIIFINYIWSKKDEESKDKYYKKALNNDTNILKYICAMSHKWYGTGGPGYNFDDNEYKRYISDEIVLDIINRNIKYIISNFDKDSINKIASFVISKKTNNEHVDKKQVEKLIKEWKK